MRCRSIFVGFFKQRNSNKKLDANSPSNHSLSNLVSSTHPNEVNDPTRVLYPVKPRWDPYHVHVPSVPMPMSKSLWKKRRILNRSEVDVASSHPLAKKTL